MRSNRQTTSQTTCDYEADDFTRCHAYAITGFYQPAASEEQAAKHASDLAVDGWADVEGRDYCPDHDPRGAVASDPPAPTAP